MTFSKTTLLALAASTMLAGAVFAEDAAGGDKKPDAPKTEKKDAKAKPIKLTLPYSLIDSSLTQEQKEKINKIHLDAKAERDKIDEKEKDDSMAVLTDDQKAKLKEAEEKKEAERKAKMAGDKKTDEKKSDEKKPDEKK